MMKFSKEETDKLVSYANSYGIAGAIVALILGLALLSFGGSNILGVFVITAIGYTFAFLKGFADGADTVMKSKLTDSRR